MNKINNIFDEIHCILYVESQERCKNVQNTFKKYNINNVQYTYTFNKPFWGLLNIKDSLPSIQTSYYDYIYETNKNIYNRVFDCALNHYNIIKSAYLRGLEHILVFEDDINIIVEPDIFDSIIDKIPNDFDIIKFYNGLDQNNLPKTELNNIEYTKNFNYLQDENNNDCLSSMMIGYSRKGMKRYIDDIEECGIQCSDLYYSKFIKEQQLNIYKLTSYFINDHAENSLESIFLS
jgi:GR25 family glycosyltransferase involved in LPS biosynthesis